MAGLPLVILAIVAKDDVSLQCTTSLMQLQQEAVQRQVCTLDLHIVSTFLEALNLYDKGQYLVIIDGQCGVRPEFVFGLIASKHKVVAGVYPLPVVNWDRLALSLSKAHHTSKPALEPIHHAGNVYNLTPANGGFARYLPVKTGSVQDLRVLGLATQVLRDMAGPHNAFSVQGETKHLFAYDAVFDDTLHNPYQTFVRLLPASVTLMADVQEQCVLSGPAQFAGCVGMRGYVR